MNALPFRTSTDPLDITTFMPGDATVVRGNARDIPLPDNSVNLIVTSPPYLNLRSYTDGGEHYEGQIGDEPTMEEFLDSLIEVTRECARVLKPSGSLWVNLGDKYNAYNGNRGEGTIQKNKIRQKVPTGQGLERQDGSPEVSGRYPVPVRHPLYRRPRVDPSCRGGMGQGEYRSAGVGEGPCATQP